MISDPPPVAGEIESPTTRTGAVHLPTFEDPQFRSACSPRRHRRLFDHQCRRPGARRPRPAARREPELLLISQDRREELRGDHDLWDLMHVDDLPVFDPRDKLAALAAELDRGLPPAHAIAAGNCRLDGRSEENSSASSWVGRLVAQHSRPRLSSQSAIADASVASGSRVEPPLARDCCAGADSVGRGRGPRLPMSIPSHE